MKFPRALTALVAACSLMLASCAPLLSGALGALGGVGVPAPQAVQTATAPLAAVHVDEQALRVALAGFDTVLYAVDALVAAKVLVKNTPRAKTIAGYLTACKDALNAAFDIATALNNPIQTLSVQAVGQKAAEYRRLLGEAETAFRSARSAISGQSASLDRAFEAFDHAMGDLRADKDVSELDARRALVAFQTLKRAIATERALAASGIRVRTAA